MLFCQKAAFHLQHSETFAQTHDVRAVRVSYNAAVVGANMEGTERSTEDGAYGVISRKRRLLWHVYHQVRLHNSRVGFLIYAYTANDLESTNTKEAVDW